MNDRKAQHDRELAEIMAEKAKNHRIYTRWRIACKTAERYGKEPPTKPEIKPTECLQHFQSRWREFYPLKSKKINRLADWKEWKQLPPEEIASLSPQEHKKSCELWCAAHPITLEGVENLSKILIDPE